MQKNVYIEASYRPQLSSGSAAKSTAGTGVRKPAWRARALNANRYSLGDDLVTGNRAHWRPRASACHQRV
jgi:hypothetical protein